MAKAKAGTESKSAVFTRLFETNKELLGVPSIAEVLKMFEAETRRPITDKDRQVAANVKSKLRKKHGMRRRRKGKRRTGAAGGVAVAVAPRATASMLALEDAIDDCIYLARRMETDRLADVVRQLRRARNHLIVMTGAK